ncbi:MAG: hypothetical protein M3Y21_04395 [Candidatus Eremiobacteraeota bacterium]|nr:hypothetical protein [Candidatus Eremiobacteraeota bacterium]
MKFSIGALVLFGALALTNLPMRAAAAPAPSVQKVGAVTVVRQNDPQSTLDGVQLFVKAGLDRQTPAENGLAALTAETIVQPIRAPIAAAGGSIDYAVDGRYVRFYLEGRKTIFQSQILPLFESALAKPDFGGDALRTARASLDRKISADQSVALTVGIEMLNRAFYTDSDAGLPQYGLPGTLAGLGTTDAQRFFAANYRSEGAILSAAGDLSTLSSSATGSLAASLQPGGSAPIIIARSRLVGSSRQLIAHRDVPVAWLVAQYPAPAIGSRDFGAMLVLMSFVERTLSDVAQVPSVASKSLADRSIGVIYNFDAQPANLIMFVDGGKGDPNRVFGTALTVVGLFGSTKLNGDIESTKRAARGRFLAQATTLEDRAWIAGVFAARGGSADYLSRGEAAIAAVTASDLQIVAHRYLSSPTVALVLPRG